MWLKALLLWSFFLPAIAFSQAIKILNIDTTSIEEVYLFNSNKIGLHPTNNRPLILGDFISKDFVPFFFYSAEEQEMFRYFTDLSPFVLSRANAKDYCFDAENNIYIAGGSNNQMMLWKLNHTLTLDWTLATGHHSFQDLCYKNGNIYTVGQGEDSLGNHLIMISKTDTSGVHQNTKLIGIKNLNNMPRAILAHNNSLFVFSEVYENEYQGISVLELNENLDVLHDKLFYRIDASYTISDVYLNRDFFISGNIKGGQNADTTYFLKIDSNLNLIENSSFYFKNFDSIEFRNSGIIANGDMAYLSCTLEENKIEFPTLLKYNLLSNDLGAKKFYSDTLVAYRNINALCFNATKDSIYFSGSIIHHNTENFYRQIYLQTTDCEKLTSDCSEILKINSIQYIYETDSGFLEVLPRDTFKLYSFGNNSDFFIFDTLCYTPDTLGFLSEVNKKYSVYTSDNELYIGSKYPELSEYYIFDSMGKLIESSSFRNQTTLITNHLQTGIYIVRITRIGTLDVFTSKILIHPR